MNGRKTCKSACESREKTEKGKSMEEEEILPEMRAGVLPCRT